MKNMKIYVANDAFRGGHGSPQHILDPPLEGLDLDRGDLANSPNALISLRGGMLYTRPAAETCRDSITRVSKQVS